MDRARRIGEARTVTLFRLAMKHSIEEEMMNPHAAVRDLAEIFSGTDADGKMRKGVWLALTRED